ncbi:SGNH/GDSL hydrolase family protein [Campylobacter sp. MIT 97-5078]|uniref:SGNH/GDSL hydrolase family protein n=1 Tax=Campylobacter sp. MIT 97-5078 TaxID=1548153 RepID=UPI000512C218|nr:DUF459 domain-containing protein [Campylobacter sp. MIT 97-5078]KGI55970.1 hypothetical protein LR59_09595 [Campylobacter sp. MIT 97-5078]KGI57436.1 hypothetical protein LR59_01640 [Campylobacter sp. MIT 97-5078]TQR27358.1 DUF459 domain-containing protein [Campylobacter sp. MIT 97-5078]
MRIFRFFFVILSTFFIVTFVMNKSIASYLEQKYHLHIAFQNDILDEANGFKVKLEQIRAVLSNDTQALYYGSLSEFNTNDINDINVSSNEAYLIGEFDENISKIMLDSDENISIQSPDANLRLIPSKLVIQKGEEFLLIGDSLMQGVALALTRDLSKLKIKSTNLSKQSTGLSYKSYFNWASAIQAAFVENKNLKYLVVLLGANDPWDIKFEGKYKTFNSEQWREIYASRVDEIIKIAKLHNAKVLWYEIPPVKKDSLNEKIKILNEIYRSENLKNNEIFIQTTQALSEDGKYSSYIRDENNKSIKVRADDGTHFNIKGAKLMSELLFEKLDTNELK